MSGSLAREIAHTVATWAIWYQWQVALRAGMRNVRWCGRARYWVVEGRR